MYSVIPIHHVFARMDVCAGDGEIAFQTLITAPDMWQNFSLMIKLLGFCCA